MKKIFYVFAAALMMTACGGNKNADASSNEATNTEETANVEKVSDAVEEPVVEEENNLLKPPFTVLAKRMTKGASDVIPLDSELKKESPNSYQITTYDFTVNANGTWSGKLTTEECDWRTNYEWVSYPSGSAEFEGKWKVDYRAMGEGHEKVYELNNGNYSIYIPESGDYLWVGDWDGCRDMRTKSTGAYQILEVKK